MFKPSKQLFLTYLLMVNMLVVLIILQKRLQKEDLLKCLQKVLRKLNHLIKNYKYNFIYLILDRNKSKTEYLEPRANQSVNSFVEDLIKEKKIVVFSKTTCPFCAKVKELFNSLKYEYTTVELDQIGIFLFSYYLFFRKPKICI